LAGMPLGASTLNGSGTKGTISKPNETSSSNLGLILGLCIPIGTLCKIYINFSNCWRDNIDLEKK
jgi:hypothetical protein